MKASRDQIERAVKAPDASTRFLLLYGPDESGSRGLAKALAASLGADADRIDLSGSELRSDPARLADEAASLSLFGGRRYIIVEPAGDEVLAAAEALLEAPEAGNPVAMVAGALKPASKLLKLALASPYALAFASYVPDAREAGRLVTDMARAAGLTVRSDLARRVAEASGNDRAVIGQEIGKFALYLDASPDRTRELDEEAVAAVGAGRDEGDVGRLVDSVGTGDARTLRAELLRLSSQGIDGIVLIRAVLRRFGLLARLRAEVDSGSSVAGVMASQGKSLFWKEKDAIGVQLQRWRSDLLAKAMSRLLEAERQVKASGSAGPVLVEEELFAICRQAARLAGK